MGQPNPPGDIPLFEGLGSEWNDIVGAIPEDKRAELAPRLKERLDKYEPYKQWEDLQRSGITPQQASEALQVRNVLENKPREVYEAIGRHLNITPQQAQEIVEEIEEGDEDDPRIATLQQQFETLAQITLAQRQQEVQDKLAADEDAKLDRELKNLSKKYSDVDEEEIVMRMMHRGMSAEEAYQDYSNKLSGIRRTKPAPMLLSNGGSIPKPAVDPTKLDSAGTKNLVAQMMQHALDEKNRP